MSLTALIIIWLLIQFPLGIVVGKCIRRGRGDESMGVNALSMGVNARSMGVNALSMGVNARSMGVNARGKRARVFVDDLDAA